jgi:amidase
LNTDICFMPATALATRLRNKHISAREVMAAHLDQIARVNPRVNAIITLVAEQALAQAAAADEALAHGQPLGPLHGLPIAHKDLQDTAGIRTTYGSPLYANHVPAQDTLLVERFKRAGAICLGKTNTPEFGAGSQTFNAVFGATRNPYDLNKTCGGSSGGAAVALACGMLPIADGSDMGGSLRNPASFCNVVGLRPSPGRVPSWPKDMAWSPLSVDGPMARNVADVALILCAIAGPDARAPISIAEPASLFARPLAREFKNVRIAWASELADMPFDPRVRAVVDAQRNTFEALGCTVQDAAPDFRDADEAFKTLRAWSFAIGLGEEMLSHRDQLKDTIVWNVEAGLKLSGADVGAAEVKRTELFHRARRFMQTYEFFVLPTVQVPPFDVAQPYITEINTATGNVPMTTYIDWMKSCYYITTLGHPAISVPCGFTEDGLPVGLQIVGRHQDDWGVLQLAHAFEQATRVGERKPALVQ